MDRPRESITSPWKQSACAVHSSGGEPWTVSPARSGQHQRPGLLGIRGGVVAVEGEQLLVGALLDDPAVLEDDDPVAAADRGDLVRDDQAGAAGEVLLQGLLDPRLGLGVEGAGAVVEQQDGGVGDEGPGQGQALPLAAGEREPALADRRVQAGGRASTVAARSATSSARRIWPSVALGAA